jgi:hypothetical protein
MYETIILPVVLYECDIWSVTLREEYRRRVFENIVLWKIFGPKRDEVTGEWRRLHNEELHNLYSSPNIVQVIKSRGMRWSGVWHVWGKVEVRTEFWWRNLTTRDYLEDLGIDSRIILNWIFKNRMGGMGWIDLAQDTDKWPAVLNAVTNLWVS